jgi:RNA polymerase sigma factor (sigma-70 family)
VSHEQTEFAEFFQASWEPCLRAVIASTGSVQLAEDQVAEAFARAWLSWRKVRRHPAPRAWVVRTALNAGASWWRRRVRELPLADFDAVAPRDVDDGLDDGLLTALRHLPDRQREVIALRVFLDLDIDTIAAHLGVAPGTVRVHLSRGVRALRQELSASAASASSSSSSSSSSAAASASSASASAALEVNR